MWMLWVGVALLLLKLAGIWDLSWWWVALPFVGALIWFEVFEKRLGLDKKKAFDELDRAKQDRIKRAMDRGKPAGRGRR